MKNVLLIATTLMLIGAGCVPAADGPQLEVRPTVTVLEAGNTHATIEGSYCGKTMCVDKIAPQDLVKESDYEMIDDAHLTVQSSEALTDLSVGLMTSEGEFLKCAIPSERINELSYLIDLCAIYPGTYILDLELTFAESGSGSYLFPYIIDTQSRLFPHTID